MTTDRYSLMYKFGTHQRVQPRLPRVTPTLSAQDTRRADSFTHIPSYDACGFSDAVEINGTEGETTVVRLFLG